MVTLFIIAPLLYGVIFGLVYSKGKLNHLPIVVVDKDHSPLSRQLTDMLDDADVLAVKDVRQEAVGLEKIFYQDSVYAVVEVPFHFEQDVLQGRHPELVTYVGQCQYPHLGVMSRDQSRQRSQP